MQYNLKLDLVNINVYKNLVKFCTFILKILSGKEILTSIKGRNSVTNLQKMCNNPNSDLVNINVFTNDLIKFCLCILKILSGNKVEIGTLESQNYRIMGNLV